jgi:hypothetical protein
MEFSGSVTRKDAGVQPESRSAGAPIEIVAATHDQRRRNQHRNAAGNEPVGAAGKIAPLFAPDWITLQRLFG